MIAFEGIGRNEVILSNSNKVERYQDDTINSEKVACVDMMNLTSCSFSQH